ISTLVFFYQAEDGIRDFHVTGVQTCALPICAGASTGASGRTKRSPPRRGASGGATAASCGNGSGSAGRRLREGRTGRCARSGARSEERRGGEEFQCRSSPTDRTTINGSRHYL